MITAISQRKNEKVIAISPGSRYWGIAIFDGKELLDWRIRVLRRGSPKAKLEQAVAILDDLLSRYQPQMLILKRLQPQRSSVLLDQLVTQISSMARRRGLRLYWLSSTQMAERLTPGYRSNKRRLFKLAAEEHPFLVWELAAARANKHPYHDRMLEAVVMGMALFTIQ